ncbi:FHA domain-containing protein [Nocardia sp. NPDC020380]|uniref:FHA domain-containing protein n=1 Tax=Nocardia sp. NPDC020380 TaxID=3364309 RepID=UPI0037A1CAF2
MTGRVEVVPGGHLVASVDGVVVVVAHRDPQPLTGDSDIVGVLETLLGMVQEAASRETRRTGRTFARLVSTWLMNREDEERVEFGVLTPGTRGLAVFLHGGLTAVLDGDERHEVLHGRDAGFTIDRMVSPAPSRAAGVFVDEESPREDIPEPGIWSLVHGRMPGSGAVVWLNDPVESPSRRGAADAVVEPTAPENATDVLDDVPAMVAEPAPGQGDSPAGPATSGPSVPPNRVAVGVPVRGVLCARHHLNDPRLVFCTSCGARIDQMNALFGEGIRPSLGVLRLDDGTAYSVDADMVIGREPERSDAVRRGARSIRIADASGGMSRVHAEIRLADWDVTVLDRGSANGTHIRPPGRPDWIRAAPGHPVVLESGSQVLLGGRVFSFDARRAPG